MQMFVEYLLNISEDKLFFLPVFKIDVKKLNVFYSFFFFFKESVKESKLSENVVYTPHTQNNLQKIEPLTACHWGRTL